MSQNCWSAPWRRDWISLETYCGVQSVVIIRKEVVVKKNKLVENMQHPGASESDLHDGVMRHRTSYLIHLRRAGFDIHGIWPWHFSTFTVLWRRTNREFHSRTEKSVAVEVNADIGFRMWFAIWLLYLFISRANQNLKNKSRLVTFCFSYSWMVAITSSAKLSTS